MKASFVEENAFKFEDGPHFSSLKQMDFFPFSCAMGAYHGISDITLSNSAHFCLVTECYGRCLMLILLK